MRPLDLGITAAAVLLLVYAARAMFTKEGKSQLGCGFAFVAALVWSIAIGRRVPDFELVDGLRLAVGALLLLPALRAIFQHGKGSIVTAALGLVLASVVAGPVVQRYLDRAELGARESAGEEIAATDAEIERLEAVRAGLLGDLLVQRNELVARGHAEASDVAGDPIAMEALRKYAGFKARIDDIDARLAKLHYERANLVAAQEAPVDVTEAEIERIRREVREAANLSEKSALELYSEQKELLELFERDVAAPKED